jgi:hypothetical protein
VLQPSKVVILLTGRYAGKKAVIVKNFDDGTSSRPYGHALVVGLAKEPRKVGLITAFHAGWTALDAIINMLWASDTELSCCTKSSGWALVFVSGGWLQPAAFQSTGFTESQAVYVWSLGVQVIKKSSQKTQARRSSIKVRGPCIQERRTHLLSNQFTNLRRQPRPQVALCTRAFLKH